MADKRENKENKKEYRIPSKEERTQYWDYYIPSKAEREFLLKVTDVIRRYLSRYNIENLRWAEEQQVFAFGLYGDKKVKLLGLQKKQPISITVNFKWNGNVITISGFNKKLNIEFSGTLDNKEQLRRGFINYKKRNQDTTNWMPRNICVDENNRYESDYSSSRFADDDNVFGSSREEDVIPMAIPDVDIAGDFTDLDDCGDPM